MYRPRLQVPPLPTEQQEESLSEQELKDLRLRRAKFHRREQGRQSTRKTISKSINKIQIYRLFRCSLSCRKVHMICYLLAKCFSGGSRPTVTGLPSTTLHADAYTSCWRCSLGGLRDKHLPIFMTCHEFLHPNPLAHSFVCVRPKRFLICLSATQADPAATSSWADRCHDWTHSSHRPLQGDQGGFSHHPMSWSNLIQAQQREEEMSRVAVGENIWGTFGGHWCDKSQFVRTSGGVMV